MQPRAGRILGSERLDEELESLGEGLLDTDTIDDYAARAITMTCQHPESQVFIGCLIYDRKGQHSRRIQLFKQTLEELQRQARETRPAP